LQAETFVVPSISIEKERHEAAFVTKKTARGSGSAHLEKTKRRKGRGKDRKITPTRRSASTIARGRKTILHMTEKTFTAR